MPCRYHTVPVDLSDLSWTLNDDQQHLCDALQRFARQRLAPLLVNPATPDEWSHTVRLAAELDLGGMILPAHDGEPGLSDFELCLLTGIFAAGPLECAAELTLSTPALTTLREHNALDRLPARNIRDYFGGGDSISLTVPGARAGTAFVLSRHDTAPMLLANTRSSDASLVLVEPDATAGIVLQRHRIATLGALSLEQVSLDRHALAWCTPISPASYQGGVGSAGTWLIKTGLYLSALLVGAMHASISFAFGYAGTRHAFRKPLAAHQLVATRLADMLVAAEGARLLLWAVARNENAVPAQDAGAPISGTLCSRIAPVRQLMRHVAASATDISRDLVQLCGGHGYVEGLPPARRFQVTPFFTLLLSHAEAALAQWTPPSGMDDRLRSNGARA